MATGVSHSPPRVRTERRLRGSPPPLAGEVPSEARRRARHQGLHFRKQHPIGPFIADFACVSAMLTVEVDGATHGSDAQVAYDRRRTAFLQALGWREIRVTNNEVYKNLDGVLEHILSEAAKRRPLPPSLRDGPPPPQAGEETSAGARRPRSRRT